MNMPSCMLRLLALALLSIGSLAAQTRPVVLNETTKIVPPLGTGVNYLALSGDHMLALGGTETSMEDGYAVFHYQRMSSGEWTYMGLVTYTANSGDPYSEPSISLKGAIGAVTINDGGYAAVLEYTGGGWQVHRISLPGPNSSGAAISGNRVAFGFHGDAPSSLAIVEKNSAGVWAISSILEGTIGQHDGDYVGPHGISLAENQLSMAGDYFLYPGGDTQTGNETVIFDRVNGQWVKSHALPREYDSAIIDNRIGLFMERYTGPNEIASFFTRNSAGAWANKHTLLTDEFAFDHFVRNPAFTSTRAFAQADMLAFGSVGTVFRREASGRYQHVATLAPSDVLGTRNYDDYGNRIRNVKTITNDGNRIAAIWYTPEGRGGIYVFDVPTALPSPRVLEDTFQDANALGWLTHGPGNWSVVSSDGSYVYRQQSTTGDARAVLGESDATNQSIQADMRVRSGGGTAPWAGLMVRYTDPGNFYYLLVNSKSIQIRRIVNGVFEPIATVPFTWALGRTYNFRLEAIGKRIRAFRDGELAVEAIDASHARGSAGLTMWRAATDYDNVIVTSNPVTALGSDRFSTSFGQPDRDWIKQPANAWVPTTVGSETVLRQTAPTGDARALIGAFARDQIVSATITPRTFASNTGWVGLMARYRDNQNYYYVVVRNATKLSLRKLVNGVIHTIEEIPFNVQANTRYHVRLEAIGSALRMYVNGRLVAEGVDTDLATGRFGLVTYNATADFDDFSATRP